MLWLIAPLCACAFLVWSDCARIRRIEAITRLLGGAEAGNRIDPKSPTGYANGQRELIVPQRNETGFDWIIQTQQMLARKEWRIRNVDYDNAPTGRAVNATSPYRWWLGLVAWGDHVLTRRPPGLSVESAALFADPLLYGLVLAGAAGFVAWRFGPFAAALISIGLTAIFPLPAGYLPGVLDDHGLAWSFSLAGLLLLLAGIRDAEHRTRWFSLAGIAGGLGMWVNVTSQTPVMLGVFLGALIAMGTGGVNAKDTPSAGTSADSWRAWALGGAATVLAAYLAEYSPGHLGAWHLKSIHPLYGLAWLGGGELLARVDCRMRRDAAGLGWRNLGVMLIAVAAVASVPVAMILRDGRGSLVRDLFSGGFSTQPGSILSADLGSWLAFERMNATVLATLLPLVVLAPAGWLLLRRSTSPQLRLLVAVACGPVLVALGFACREIGWLGLLDCTLLVLVIAMVGGNGTKVSRSFLWLWATLTALVIAPGVFQLIPARTAGARISLNPSEAEELVERDLAHWLTKRNGESGAVVYAPPQLTTPLCYFGGLRGIGTLAPENRIGLGVTLMIAAANMIDEVHALIEAHGVRYVIVPSWDPFFNDFAQLYLKKRFSNRKCLFIDVLRLWSLPLWVRPLAYRMPEIPGFEGQSVLVFEISDSQSPAAAASRLAEYFIEMGQLDQAAEVSEQLKRFPGDVGALAAMAQVQRARGDTAELAKTLQSLLVRLANGDDRFLPWDRRVSLAMVLAQANHFQLARKQVRGCLAKIDATKLRNLSEGLLYNLQVLSQAFGLPIADPALHRLALQLLSPELRSRL